MGNFKVKSHVSIKYLGVQIVVKLAFKYRVAKKTSRTFGALSRFMPNVGGSKSKRRIMLSRALSSIILYAAPI